MGQIADTLSHVIKPSIGLAEAMLKDVKPERFARFTAPGGKTIHANHPAWNYGHLALYPAKILEIGGLTGDIPTPPAAWGDLFAAGTACKDDPEGTIYPAMAEITEAYFAGYKALAERLASVDDATFAKPHGGSERMREMMPTYGAAAVFMVTSHVMMHMGQVSTWRRCEGLGSVM